MMDKINPRHEVAERLRAKYRERNAPGMFEVQDAGMQAYGYLKDLESCLPDGESAFTVIADLIDPTCHQVLEDETQVCSECGGDLDERYGWNYCPECGCRVVVRGDNDE